MLHFLRLPPRDDPVGARLRDISLLFLGPSTDFSRLNFQLPRQYLVLYNASGLLPSRTADHSHQHRHEPLSYRRREAVKAKNPPEVHVGSAL